MPEFSLFVIFGLLIGFYMAWTIGANDVANAMGTSVGSKTLTLGAAVVVAAVFEFGGAFFAGGHVADTIKGNVVDLKTFAADPNVVAIGMLSALLSAALWLHIATWRGWPVSTTHSIVGAVAGFGMIVGGIHAVRWSVIGRIVASWVLSPLLGAVVAWIIFTIVRRLVFRSEHPLQRARVIVPIIVGIVAGVLTMAMIYKGLKNLKLDLPGGQAVLISLAVGAATYGLATLVLPRFTPLNADSFNDEVRSVERQFRYLQVVTACYVAFAHGSNDAANAVGPMAAVLTARAGTLGTSVAIPVWILALGGVGIIVGLATYGYKVIYTIGNKITELTPSRGFAMEFSTASVVLLGSKLGLPVSTTHIIIGAVVGVGFARGMAALNTRIVAQIVWSWLITIPVAALLAAGIYGVLIHVF